MLIIIVSFSAAFLVTLGICVYFSKKPGMEREVHVILEDGFRVAGSIALLALIGIVTDSLINIFAEHGLARSLIPDSLIQNGGPSWQTVSILAIIFLSMTIIVLGGLWAILHIVRQD